MTDADFIDAVMRLKLNTMILASIPHSTHSAEKNRELADSGVEECEKLLSRVIEYVAGLNPNIVTALQDKGKSPT